ncbi:MAG: oligosaccharide flippase family protein [Chloroflexi bacterium]|nr:oligosaccharide flippase family protein [Chloroflexota bacterium]
MIERLRHRANTLDLSLIKTSTVLTVGITVARLLGFGFSLILARLLTPDDYGLIQYTITLAGIVAIGTQPFAQHVLARFTSQHLQDQEQLSRFLNTAWWVLAGVFGVTLFIAVPALALSNRLSLGVMAVFIGITAFYTYYGLARGFIASYRLLAAYLGSNFVQLVLIFIVYALLRNRSTQPALLIYGLSYFLPLAVLQAVAPLPFHFRLALPDPAIFRRLLRFSAPIWISHAAYIIYAAIDVLLLEHYLQTAAVGIYVLTKTLTTLFGFAPMAIATILLPRITASPRQQRLQLLKNAMALALAANAVLLLGFLLTYRWFITQFFGPDYVLPLVAVTMLAVAEITFGLHGIITAAVVGVDQAHLETISRIVIVITAVIVGAAAVPALGITGAALTALTSAAVAMLTYAVAGLRWYRQKQALQVTETV